MEGEAPLLADVPGVPEWPEPEDFAREISKANSSGVEFCFWRWGISEACNCRIYLPARRNMSPSHLIFKTNWFTIYKVLLRDYFLYYQVICCTRNSRVLFKIWYQKLSCTLNIQAPLDSSTRNYLVLDITRHHPKSSTKNVLVL